MKTFAPIILLAVSTCSPMVGYCDGDPQAANAPAPMPAAQAPAGSAGQTVPGDFCKNDPRREIRALCGDLTNFLRDVTTKKVSRISDAKDDLDKLDVSNGKATTNIIDAMAASLALSAALQTADQSRLDKQLSSASSASGTTSLISKAGSADLLSLALDTGALTQSVNGATSTLSTNADQVFRLITGHNPDCKFTLEAGCGSLGWFEKDILNETNIVATFALAQQSSTTTATSGQASGSAPTQVSTAAIPTGAGRLSSISARYEFRNKFDPRSTKFQAALTCALKNQSDTLNAVAKNIFTSVDKLNEAMKASAPPLDNKTRLKLFQAAKSDLTGKALVNAFEDYFAVAVTALAKDQNFSNAVGLTTQYRTVYENLWQDAINQAAGSLFTTSYTYNKPLNQPYTHDITLIFAHDFQDYGMLTFNGAVSIYDGALPPGAKYGHIHDGQISGEYDRTLTGKNGSTQTQLSIAGYWQYQPNPSVLNIPAGTVAPGTTIPIPNGTQEFVGTAGSLWVTQVKITIKVSKGINIPLGVSWSNKTDLLQGNKVGAQVGISYDFSSLKGLFTGGGGQ